METERVRYFPREVAKTSEGILNNPPQIILVFDFQDAKEQDAKAVMGLRAAVAASIYHSTLYDGKQKPLICCFAGEHKPGGEAGSAKVKEYLLEFGVKAEDIDTRETTITTNTDIMQLHSVMRHNKNRKIDGPVAIITTDWHIKRTEQELVNHFNQHTSARHKMPLFYVIGPSSPELQQLLSDKKETGLEELRQRIEDLKPLTPKGGLTEEIAYWLSKYPFLKKYLQPLAEKISHPTPKKLAGIQKILKTLNELKQRKEQRKEQLKVEDAVKILDYFYPKP